MAKGKATNPKARTKAVPKKTPKPPASKKGKSTTQCNKNKGPGTSRKQGADDESSVNSSDDEPDLRPFKKHAKPSAPTSDEEDSNEPDDEPEVIDVDDEGSQSESEVLNSKSGSYTES